MYLHHEKRIHNPQNTPIVINLNNTFIWVSEPHYGVNKVIIILIVTTAALKPKPTIPSVIFPFTTLTYKS